MKIKLLFAWYDLWVGFFWDKRKMWLYILPIPMFGAILKFLPDNYSVKECMSHWSGEGEIKTFILYYEERQVGSFKTLLEAKLYANKHNYNLIETKI